MPNMPVREHVRLNHDDRRKGGRHDQGLAPSPTAIARSSNAARSDGDSRPNHKTVRGAQMKAIELQRCARAAIETCGSVQPKERVLIVTDTMRDQSVARALMAAALAADAEPVLMVMPTRRSTPQEPPGGGPGCNASGRHRLSVYDIFADPLVGARGGSEDRRADYHHAWGDRGWICQPCRWIWTAWFD